MANARELKQQAARKLRHAGGAVGGYLRVSLIKFPPDCTTAEQRAAHVEMLRTVRRAELVADAAKDGETITEWYDDLGISGRGEYLDLRVAFAQARRDAHSGHLRVLYARDLSRLFRDLVQQEHWFAEMERWGCEARVQDLPYAGGDSFRTLIRQQMGAIYEFNSTRMGEMIAASHEQHIREGKWVGRNSSKWGLRYDPATMRFHYDPDTADHAVLVFETFIAMQGNAAATARKLNALVLAGDPRATPSPNGRPWRNFLVWPIVRDPLYRRTTTYRGVPIPLPALIPAVVPPALLATVDTLLAYAPGRGRLITDLLENFTYARLLTCGDCGTPLVHRRSRERVAPDPPQPPDRPAFPVASTLGWICPQSSRRAGKCLAPTSAMQYRIDRLVGRGLALALAQYGKRHGLSWVPPPPEAVAGYSPATVRETSVSLDNRTARIMDLYARGIIKTPADLQPHLDALAAERRLLDAQRALPPTKPRAPEGVGLPGAQSPADYRVDRMPQFAGDEWKHLCHHVTDLWAPDCNSIVEANAPSHTAKREMLTLLGVRIAVRVLPREPGRPRTPGNIRKYGGIVTLAFEAAALGVDTARALALAETEAEFKAHLHWRARGASATRKLFGQAPPRPRRGDDAEDAAADSEDAG